MLSQLARRAAPSAAPASRSRFLNHGSLRAFSAGGGATHEDNSLQGRYAQALFQVTQEKKNLDKVWNDLDHLRACMAESKEFANFVTTPAIGKKDKAEGLKGVAAKYGYDVITTNFLGTLLENSRLHELEKMIASFEGFYHAEMGQVICVVTAPKELTAPEQGKVKAALQARAGASAKLIVSYKVNDSLLGGLQVKMGEQVFDYSVASRLERLQGRLLQAL